jgi:putative ABC transport system permease protein
MRAPDVLRFAWRALSGARTRTLLMELAMAIGVAAVVVLTSLGEGARGYVRDQFRSLGASLIVIFPGRAETAAGSAGLIAGRTPRDLTLDDALALRRIPGVRLVAPINVGSADVWARGRSREAPILGSTAELLEVRHLTVATGDFLPAGDPRQAASVCVVGANVRRELFGADSPLGTWLRIGDRRFRVVGVLASHGQSLGLDIDDVVIIPVASAQVLFNLPSLLRIAVEAHSREDVKPARREILRLLRERHGGEEDVTVVTEDAVAASFDRILGTLTLAVAGIASVSLAVAGILIMNVMLISVTQRTGEIGLLKALGATPGQIRLLFLAEAAALSSLGGLAGSLLGQAGSLAIRQYYPVLPAYAPAWAALAAFATAIITGVIFGLLPARRAARLQPAFALSRR